MRKEFLRIENGIKKGVRAEQLENIDLAVYEGEVANTFFNPIFDSQEFFSH